MVNKEAVAAWAGAAGTAVSSIIYLFDFATNLSTLRVYYLYEYECPHATLASALLDDPICHAIRSGFKLQTFRQIFWMALMLLLVAHLANAIIFGLSFDRSQHPLRLAYFLPLIHLYRLLKVLRHSFSSNSLKELQKSQMEFSSLYDALGISLVSMPQFVTQLTIILNLGQYIKGSTDPSEQAQRIPTTLLVSLVTSIISSTYGTTMAVFFLIQNRMPFSKRAFISILMGIQAFVTMLGNGVSVASLFQVTGPRASFLLSTIMTIELIIAWLFSCLLVHLHYRDRQGKSTWLRIAHSLGLAFMNRITGPMYVLIKLRTSSCFLLWGSLLHILVELLYPAFVLFWPLDAKSPCRTPHEADIDDQGNKYLTCKLFISVTVLSYIVFILATLLIIWVYKKNDGSASLLPETFRQLSQKNHSMSTFKSFISTLASAKATKDLHQLSIPIVFDYFVFLLTILCIQMLQKEHPRP